MGVSPRVAHVGRGLGPFVRRAFAPTLARAATVYAVVATFGVIGLAAAWRLATGPRGSFESVLPMLATSQRWSVGLLFAFAGVATMSDDQRTGRVSLAVRCGYGAERWLVMRSVGAAVALAGLSAACWVATALVLAGFGGGVEGALARASLALPSLVLAAVTGLLLGGLPVVLGAVLPRRGAVTVLVLGMGAAMIPTRYLGSGPAGLLRDMVSPVALLTDLEAGLFVHDDALAQGASATVALLMLALMTWLGWRRFTPRPSP